MKLTPIEGNTQKLDGGAMYGNAPKPMWEKWSPPDERNRIVLACRALLMQHAGKNILFETGIGCFFEPKLRERFGVVETDHRLVANLAKAGVRPEEIHAVVLSHLHFDHAGGMLSAFEDGPLRLIFSNAKVYVGERHWKRAQSPHLRDKASFIPALHDLLRSTNQLVLVDDSGHTDLAPLVTFRFTDGHTPGLMHAVISDDQGALVFASDLIPGASWVHVPMSMGYDRYPELLIEEKSYLLRDLLHTKGRVFFTHDPSIACGVVQCSSEGRYFVEPFSM